MRWLARLNNFFVLPAAAEFDPQLARLFRRNFTVNALDILSWMFGMSFVSVSAVLPVYARKYLGASEVVLGLIPALTDAGWFIPQLFFAPYVERLARKFPAVVWLGALERLPYLVLALAVFWLADLPRPLALAVFMGLMVWKSVAAGMVAVPWQELIAKIIPVSHRGRFFGTGNFLGQLLGVGGATVAGVVLQYFPYPQNFAVTFGLGFLAVTASFVFFMFTREPAITPAPQPPHSHRDYLHRLGNILRGNANFRAYLLSRWFTYFGGLAGGFVAVYAVERFALSEVAAAVFTGILSAGSFMGFAVWGLLDDRWGHKRVMLSAIVLWLVTLGLVLGTPTIWGIYLAFALWGFGNAGGLIADLNIAMEFGPEAERPTYIGLTRTLTGPALLIAPPLGGVIAQLWGYPAVFVTSIIFAAGGLVLLAWKVKEPRRLVTGAGLEP